MYKVELTKKAVKDIQNLKAAGLAEKTKQLIELISEDPFATPPRYEKLVGDMKGIYSRRINIQHRIVYTVNLADKVVRVLRMWTHYE